MQQQEELKLDIASRLLSGIISQDRNRRLLDRLDDIDHSLEVADELIRRSHGHSSPGAEHTLRPRPPRRTRERIVDRDEPPLQDLLDTRRGTTPDGPRPPRGPTLH